MLSRFSLFIEDKRYATTTTTRMYDLGGGVCVATPAVRVFLSATAGGVQIESRSRLGSNLDPKFACKSMNGRRRRKKIQGQGICTPLTQK